MEEEKAAAYYDELTRKGEGAARFKQGLGFSNTTNTESAPIRGSALPSSSSSFLSNFVKASSPTKASELQKQAQLESIHNKLKKKEKRSPKREEEKHQLKVPRGEERHSRRRSRSRESHRRRRSRSRSRSRERYREKKDRDRERRRSRSWSDSDDDRRRRGRGRSRSRSLLAQDRRRERRNRSSSPSERKLNKGKRGDDGTRGRVSKMEEKNGGSVDYSRLIEGYNKMLPAERIKAKMKLQLTETAEKDATKGMGSGWERFEFNKDAPLDDHDDTEAAEDDGALVKLIGQSFRFSAVKAKREEQIEAAHDVAMFGASVTVPSETTDNEAVAEAEAVVENEKKDSNGSDLAASLLSEKVLAKQQGSWRDRARGQRN